jgi:hypothetical protein
VALLKLLAAAAVGYVLVRAGWIFGGRLVAAVAVALAAGAVGAWRRGLRSVAGGLVIGALVSATVLSL